MRIMGGRRKVMIGICGTVAWSTHTLRDTSPSQFCSVWCLCGYGNQFGFVWRKLAVTLNIWVLASVETILCNN